MFADRDAAKRREFHIIETRNPPMRIALTAAHLLFVVKNSTLRETFASDVAPGQEVMILDEGWHLRAVLVDQIYREERWGSFAPVTGHGTIVVDDILASCYAAVQNQNLAHLAFAPVRIVYKVAPFLFGGMTQNDGVHWYSDFLYGIGRRILGPAVFHPLSIENKS
ncbi:Sonic hedgehog protein A [Bagarius yarrelli]|uniref:Sonic hedgehog protein A n=1 Tax=Bagarius yarrelli TaxID=175774 RepID=A0A556V3F4_BAGYA|nr:Sonic hedgehog protein A [Bagarius yarrelli]